MFKDSHTIKSRNFNRVSDVIAQCFLTLFQRIIKINSCHISKKTKAFSFILIIVGHVIPWTSWKKNWEQRILHFYFDSGAPKFTKKKMFCFFYFFEDTSQILDFNGFNHVSSQILWFTSQMRYNNLLFLFVLGFFPDFSGFSSNFKISSVSTLHNWWCTSQISYENLHPVSEFIRIFSGFSIFSGFIDFLIWN